MRNETTRHIFIIYITTSNREEAKRIARLLLKKRLVACVNIFSKVVLRS
ncbi:MAG: hypothetical protein DRN01_07240 [Thermoplasmata archaeon]|nr:divalent cation tolerance protein CutA [Thermoplasmata archaeon]RLF23854.1 MAG: hypothetical protein DRN01_07240 [Thermoplasmata archaeon]